MRITRRYTNTKYIFILVQCKKLSNNIFPQFKKKKILRKEYRVKEDYRVKEHINGTKIDVEES